MGNVINISNSDNGLSLWDLTKEEIQTFIY